MQFRSALFALACALFGFSLPALAVPFTTTVTLGGGTVQAPDATGRMDYFISPQAISPIRGAGITIYSIEMTATAANRGTILNLDWNISLASGTIVGWSAGQFTDVTLAPVSFIQRNAPVQFDVAHGSNANLSGTTAITLTGSYDFQSATLLAGPLPATNLKLASASPFDAPNGMRAQVMFWSLDGRQATDFDVTSVTLIIRGDIANPVPEPAAWLLSIPWAIAGAFAKGRFWASRINR